LKVALAGKGGSGKTTLAAALAEEFASRGLRTLAVDCDPNPTLAESFDIDSGALPRFDHAGLRRAGQTLELARDPALVEVGAGLWLLGGPPSPQPLSDAVARGIAGVLLAPRFDAVVTDLGAGPEFAEMAVGGVLNPAEVCLVLAPASPPARLAAERIEAACRRRGVATLRCAVPVDVPALAAGLLDGSSAKPD
jgi:MinD-like ATPase involved in chromosome partitioning or flagellar assembly